MLPPPACECRKHVGISPPDQLYPMEDYPCCTVVELLF